MATPIQIVLCPSTGNIGYSPVGQGAGQFGWFGLPPYFSNFTTANTSVITTTEKIMAQSGFITASMFNVGSALRISCNFTVTSSVANAVTLRLRYGAAGTTSDTLVASTGLSGATSGTSVFQRAVLEIAFSTIGASGVASCCLSMWNAAAGTGLTNGTFFSTTFALTTVNTTVASFLSFSAITAAATTSLVGLATAGIEVVKI